MVEILPLVAAAVEGWKGMELGWVLCGGHTKADLDFGEKCDQFVPPISKIYLPISSNFPLPHIFRSHLSRAPPTPAPNNCNNSATSSLCPQCPLQQHNQSQDQRAKSNQDYSSPRRRSTRHLNTMLPNLMTYVRLFSVLAVQLQSTIHTIIVK